MIDESVSTTITSALQSGGEPATAKPAPAVEKEPTEPAKLSHGQRRAQTWDKVLSEKLEEKPAAEAKTEPAKEEPPKPAEVKKDPDSKAFAALAREKAETRQLEAKVATERQAVERDKASLTTERDAFTKERASFAAEKDAFFKDPDKVAEHLVKSLGIQTLEQFKAYLTRKWSPSASSTASSDPNAPKALTQADLDKALKDDREKRELDGKVAAVYEEYDKAVEGTDVASLVYSRAEARAKGDEIANKLRALGKSFTITDIADAVDELAKDDPRYLKLQEKLGKTASTPAGSAKPATQTKAPAAKTEAVATATSAKPLAGAARLSHTARMAALLADARKEA
jgi:hypothetical protein